MAALDFPASPTNGQVYQNWIYSTAKGAWQAKPMVSAKTVTADVAPSNPANGDEWLNTLDGCLYIYYVDVDGGQWVQVKNDASFSSTLGPRVDALDASGNTNYVINGAMDFWQRGTSSGWANGYNSVDRWYLTSGASTSWAQDSTVTAGGCRYSLKATVGAAATGPYLLQAIETSMVMPLVGKTVTLSAYIATSSSAQVGLRIDYSTSVDNPLAGAFTEVSTAFVNTTTSMARYSATFVNQSTATTLRVNIGAANIPANGTMNVTGVQLQEGSVATSFHRSAPTIQGELAACQRYYEKSYNISVAPGSSTTEGLVYLSSTSDLYSNILKEVQFNVRKRNSNYALTVYTQGGTNGKWSYTRSGVSTTDGTVATYTTSDRQIGIYINIGAAWTAGFITGHWVVDNEL